MDEKSKVQVAETTEAPQAVSSAVSKKSTNPLVLGLVALLLVIGVCGGMYISSLQNTIKQQQEASSKPNELLQEVNKITEMSDEDKQAAINQLVEDSEINVTYASKAEFVGNVSTTFLVRNIENNHYPIVFEIFDEDGKSLYKSEPIGLGYEVTAISFDEPLSVGVHNCKISIGYDGQGNVNSVFPLQITVKEAEG